MLEPAKANGPEFALSHNLTGSPHYCAGRKRRLAFAPQRRTRRLQKLSPPGHDLTRYHGEHA